MCVCECVCGCMCVCVCGCGCVRIQGGLHTCACVWFRDPDSPRHHQKLDPCRAGSNNRGRIQESCGVRVCVCVCVCVIRQL